MISPHPAAVRPGTARRGVVGLAGALLAGTTSCSLEQGAGGLSPTTLGAVTSASESVPSESVPSESVPSESVPSESVPSESVPSESVPSAAPAAGTAREVLDRLPVKGRAPRTGYDRDHFGSAWTDDVNLPSGHNGCDQRSDVLRRDLVDVTLKPDSGGCVPLTGTLHDPYTGGTVSFRRGPDTSADVQIDHVVALSNAWQTGAQLLDAQRRTELATDPLNLVAVAGSVNQAKGAGDAATWLPPDRSFRCAYVARQVAVKAVHGLWITPPERDAIARILDGCPGQPLPSAADPDVAVPVLDRPGS